MFSYDQAQFRAALAVFDGAGQGMLSFGGKLRPGQEVADWLAETLRPAEA